MPWAAGKSRSIRRIASVGHYLRNYRGTRRRHYSSPERPVRHAGQRKTFVFIYENTLSDATASQLTERPYVTGLTSESAIASGLSPSLPVRLGMLPTPAWEFSQAPNRVM